MGVPRILILSACIVLALSAEETGRQRERKKDDISGPIVRATVDREKDSIILQANLSTEGAEKKKTIAQYIDEALEQEFPEDKSKDGKNYNETAKQEDVSPDHTQHVQLAQASLSPKMLKVSSFTISPCLIGASDLHKPHHQSSCLSSQPVS